MKVNIIKESVDDVINYNAANPERYKSAQYDYNYRKNGRKEYKHRQSDDERHVIYNIILNKLEEFGLGYMDDYLRYAIKDRSKIDGFFNWLDEVTEGEVGSKNFGIGKKYVKLTDDNHWSLRNMDDLTKIIHKHGKLKDEVDKKLDQIDRYYALDSTLTDAKAELNYDPAKDVYLPVRDYKKKLGDAVAKVLTDKFKVETEVGPDIERSMYKDVNKGNIYLSDYRPFSLNMRTRKDTDRKMEDLLKKLFGNKVIGTFEKDDDGDLTKVDIDFSTIDEIVDKLKKSIGANESLNEYYSGGNYVSVKYLREVLESALSELEDFDDNDKVIVSPNTYGLSDPYVATFQGFIELKNLDVEYEEDTDEGDTDESKKDESKNDESKKDESIDPSLVNRDKLERKVFDLLNSKLADSKDYLCMLDDDDPSIGYIGDGYMIDREVSDLGLPEKIESDDGIVLYDFEKWLYDSYYDDDDEENWCLKFKVMIK